MKNNKMPSTAGACAIGKIHASPVVREDTCTSRSSIKERNNMDIELDAQDLIYAAHHAGMMQAVKQMQMLKGDVANHRISNLSDFSIHYVGLLGEVALGKVIGIKPNVNITVGGDGNVDMTYQGMTIQVKTSTHKNLNHPQIRYLIFNSIEDFSTDLAVLCSIQEVSTVRIHGFATHRKFVSNVVTQDFGYGVRYCLDEKHLTPMERFQEGINYLKESK